MTRRTWTGAAGLVALATIFTSSAAVADDDDSRSDDDDDDLSVEVLAAFDAAALELPEGVAADRRGNVYATLGPPFFVGGGYGAVKRIAHGEDDDHAQTTLFELPDGPAPAGIAVSRRGEIVAAIPDPGGTAGGVYRIGDGHAERIPGSEGMVLPNGLAFDRRGDVFVTDSILGAIWVAPSRRGPWASADPTAETWFADELLAGCADDPVGANGIAFWRDDVYVANTARGLLARIEVERDGTPGELEVVAGDPDCDPNDDLYSLDGIAFDVRGRVFAVLVLTHRLVRIDLGSGAVAQLLDADDGLWNPASIAFGTRDLDEHVLISNYAVLPPAPPNNLGPAILAVDVDVRGRRLP